MADYNIGDFPYTNQENYRKKRPRPPINPESTEEDIESNQTVPGQAMTIQEIFDRSMRGILEPEDAASFLDFESLDSIMDRPVDLTDIDASRERLVELQTEIESQIAELEQVEEEEPPAEEPPVEEPPVEDEPGQ